jgi:diacylglycerol kinase (ATP)
LPDRRIVVVVNPASGHGAARAHLPEIEKTLHTHFHDRSELVLSKSAEHIQALATQAVQDGVEIFAVAGGDGTAHYALQPLVHTATALAILPIGSGNDLAVNLGIPMDMSAALQLLTQGMPRPIDVAKTKTAYYACIAGVGFDSEVNRRANTRSRWIRGRALYPYAIFRTLVEFQPRHVRIRCDGKVIDERIMFAVFANAPTYGRGIRITPKALLDDGWLDICIVKAMPKLELIRVYPKTYKGTHVDHPSLIQLRAQDISVESDEPLDLFGDGEFIEQTPIHIQAVPRALRVMTPAAA